MDLATFVNAPAAIPLNGREYLVSALTLAEWGPVQAWIKKNVPSPLRRIESGDISHLSDEDRRAVLESARIANEKWPPRVGSLAWFEALDNPGGHAEFIFAAISKHQPEFTRADAARLDADLAIADILPIVTACLGIETPDPKASGAK